MLENSEKLSARIQDIYLRELYFIGELHNLKKGHEYLVRICENEKPESDLFQKATAILCKEARLLGKDSDMLKFSLKGVAGQGSSELCMELGHYFYEKEEWDKSSDEIIEEIKESLISRKATKVITESAVAVAPKAE